MDYKVILFNSFPSASDTDMSGNFEFYTHDEAELCCLRWVEISSSYVAYLWNGAVWRFIS